MTIAVIAVPGMPDVQPGMPLETLIGDAIAAARIGLKAGDVVVVCQKVVSKAEGAVVALADVAPSPFARTLAAQRAGDADARVLEVVLRESARIVRNERGHLITQTRHGFVCANAAVDQSNAVADDVVTVLPRDPDASAEGLRAALVARFQTRLAVVVTDTFGRPWRQGLVDVAIGCAGMPALLDCAGQHDWRGRPLQNTVMALADQVAAAAGLVMSKGGGIPVAVVRGLAWPPDGPTTAASLVRPPEFDLFR